MAAAAASLFRHPSVATSVGAGYSFPSLMAAVASSGIANGDLSNQEVALATNRTAGQPVSPITPVPFRLGEFPFPGGLAAFRKYLNLLQLMLLIYFIALSLLLSLSLIHI